jgi:hypothetical protein
MLDPVILKGLTPEELANIRSLQGTKALGALLKALRIKRDSERDVLEISPQRDDRNLKNDYVYKLGAISTYQFALDLVDEVDREFKKHEVQ